MLWKKEYITKNRTFYRVESLDHFRRTRTFIDLTLLYDDLLPEELMHKLLGNKSFVYIFPSYDYVDYNNPFESTSEEDIPDSIDGNLILPDYCKATINIIDTSKLTNNNNKNKKSDWKNIWLSYYCKDKDDSKWDDEFSEWYENKISMPWSKSNLSESLSDYDESLIYDEDGELTEWGTLWLLNNSSILKKMKLKPQLLLNILNYSEVEEELENSFWNDDEDNY